MSENQIQDKTLELLKEKHIGVKIYLLNGVQINGFISAFDAYVLVVEDGQQNIVYKHAISTIIPSMDPAAQK